jgi:hypothetical protein
MVRIFCLLAMLLAGPALSETPMSASEFEAYTTGKTLYFSSRGRDYGVEEYKPNRRVTWSFLDGECQEGSWYPQGEMICFVYEAYPDPQCWTFFRRGAGLMARFENDPTATTLFETRTSEEPMMCLGPKIGV